ncbi:MAG: hypothetical protein J0M04_16790 [Verrucomicrobia bacterium]|nr:hypothetical protein [Verrucomicrobiota bacterium]
MFRKALVMPAVILGMVFGLLTNEFFLHPGGGRQDLWADYVPVAATILGIYGLLTIIVFRVRQPTFGLSPTQFRWVWIGAFLVGAIGTPLVYELAV